MSTNPRSPGRRTRRFAVLPILALLAVALTACYGSSGDPSGSVAPTSLTGTSWKALLVAGQPVVAGREPTAAFSSDQVKGSGGCNSFSGTYQYRPGAIKFGNLAMTAMGCVEPGIGLVEGRFSTALIGATTVYMDATGHMVMDGTGGQIVFEVAGGSVVD